jgi:heterotetrameric sarcosine oxidase gamma subunit
VHFEAPGIVLSERSDLRIMLIIERTTGGQISEALARHVGEVPREPNTVAGGGRVAWMAPGQWLAFGLHEDNAGIDVSDAYGAIAIEGPRARELLSKSVPLDLEHALTPGRCARTLLGSIPVFLMANEDASILALVGRSQAHAAWTWLVDGALLLGNEEVASQDF